MREGHRWAVLARGSPMSCGQTETGDGPAEGPAAGAGPSTPVFTSLRTPLRESPCEGVWASSQHGGFEAVAAAHPHHSESPKETKQPGTAFLGPGLRRKNRVLPPHIAGQGVKKVYPGSKRGHINP